MNYNTENIDDTTWENLEEMEIYGKKTSSVDFVQIPRNRLSPQCEVNNEASHCFLYARNNTKIFDMYVPRASILMQLRFDGYLGFPGGIIDKGENPVDALNRELKEEMNLDSTKHSVQANDYVVSHYNMKMGLFLHFFALEVTMQELKNIEFDALKAKDYGTEVQGNVRVPLYTMDDGYQGFPAFLNNQFIGNSKEQLLHTLKHLNLMSEDEVNRSLNAVKSS